MNVPPGKMEAPSARIFRSEVNRRMVAAKYGCPPTRYGNHVLTCATGSFWATDAVVNVNRLNTPLTEKEIEELELFLASEAVPDECMDISMLDGFLTAVMIGPSLIPPSRWMPLVWGDQGGPEYASQEQAQRIMSFIFRRMNSIGSELGATPDNFDPLFYVRTVDGKNYTIVEEWCAGFMRGVEGIEPGSWRELLADDESRQWLAQVSMFTTGEGLQAIDEAAAKLPDPDVFHEHLNSQIAPAVCKMNTFWLERRKPGAADTGNSSPRREGPSRNHPCPCGSGRKYKKCCGTVQ